MGYSRGRGREISESGLQSSSRTAKAIQTNPVSEKLANKKLKIETNPVQVNSEALRTPFS